MFIVVFFTLKLYDVTLGEDSSSSRSSSSKPKDNITEAPSELPGRKKYIPPYTPKSALDNVRMNPAPRPQPAVVKSSSLSSSSVPGKSSAPRTPSSSSRPSQSSFGGHRHLVSGSSKKRRTKNSDDELDAESKPLGRTVLNIMNISNSFLKMISFFAIRGSSGCGSTHLTAFLKIFSQ